MYEELYAKFPDKDLFLKRIGLENEEIKPDLESLNKILYGCTRNIPFENLDVRFLAAEPKLGTEALFDKIVVRKRGGYCFEKNGMLESALKAFGFECYSVLIRIVRAKDFLPPIRHRGVVVIIDGVKYFCDIGLGFRFFPEAAPFNGGYVGYGYKAVCEKGVCIIWHKNADSEEKLLMFDDVPADPVDFINPNFCCSQDANGGFRKRISLVIMTPEGYRKSLADEAFVIKDGDRVVEERTISGKEALEECFLKEFGLDFKIC